MLLKGQIKLNTAKKWSTIKGHGNTVIMAQYWISSSCQHKRMLKYFLSSSSILINWQNMLFLWILWN